ncbi:hypothetical protein NMG60_11012545 [Bertholletia excelsa]
MAEEIQGGVCGSTWWVNPTRSSLGFSSCANPFNDMASFGWPRDELVDMKARPSSCLEESMLFQFQETQKPDSVGGGVGVGVLADSAFQMMGNIGIGPSSASSSSSSTTTAEDWNHTLLSGGGTSEGNYHMPQEDMESTKLNFRPELGMGFPVNDQQSLSYVTGSTAAFPASSSSYGYSSQTLLPPQLSIFDGGRPISYPSNFNQQTNLSNEFASPLEIMRPSIPKQQSVSPFNLANSSPFLGTSSASMLASTCPNRNPKPKTNEVVEDSGSVKKKSNTNEFKRQRIETPSPLPTFKVRKEKLGDRITALQQLVSPFGKTDTASVLHEAIDYIKFLHDQVSVLSTPYLRNGAPLQYQQQACDNGPKQDLRSRGLCLVPISSTFAVANETTADFWTPTFGAMFR